MKTTKVSKPKLSWAEKLAQVAFSLCFLLVVSGCETELRDGHYEGVLKWGQSETPFGDPVGLDLSFSGRKGLFSTPTAGVVQVRNRHGQLITSVPIEEISSEGFSIYVPALDHARFDLRRQEANPLFPERQCYLFRDQWYVEFCQEHRFLRFIVRNPQNGEVFNLSSTGFEYATLANEKIPLEEPTVFRLEDAILKALSMNDQKAEGSEFLKTLEKANTVAHVEQRAYSLNRAQRIANLVRDTSSALKKFALEVEEFEKSKILKDGSRAKLAELEEFLAKESLDYTSLAHQEIYILSKALGFANPEAVEEVRVPPLDSKNLRQPISMKELSLTAPQRSLGFEDFVSNKGGLKSRKEARFAGEFLKAELSSAALVAEEFNHALAVYKLKLESTDRRNKNLEKIFEIERRYIQTKNKLPRSGIYRRVHAYVRKQKEMIVAEFDYQIAASKLDRLLLGGYFDLLQPHFSVYPGIESAKVWSESKSTQPLSNSKVPQSQSDKRVAQPQLVVKMQPLQDVSRPTVAPQKVEQDKSAVKKASPFIGSKKGSKSASLPPAQTNLMPFKKTNKSEKQKEEAGMPTLGIQYLPVN
ncbi:MAG: hypothetical protein HYX41_01140 [Bdellovibrio sp.]|nr:hypothetical protein [Bdellovibrio sp.]